MRSLVLASLLAAAIAPAALALPGESIKAELDWAKRSAVVGPLERNAQPVQSDEWSYASTVARNGDEVAFYVWTKGQTVTAEHLFLQPKAAGAVAFTRKHAGGLKLLAKLYGKAIADDFRQAKPLYAYKQFAVPDTGCFYQGKRFGYHVLNGPDHRAEFTIRTNAANKAEAERMRREAEGEIDVLKSTAAF